MGSRVLYELDYRKPVLYVIPIQSILGKLAVVPVGDTLAGTIPYHLRNVFPGAERKGRYSGCGRPRDFPQMLMRMRSTNWCSLSE